MYHRIKQIRRALGLNQHDFAAQLGFSQSTLAMLEVGKRTMSEKHVKLICSAFHVNECWLRTGEGDMFGASPYEKEFSSIFQGLLPDTQKYLLDMARGLRDTQQALLKAVPTLPSDQ